MRIFGSELHGNAALQRRDFYDYVSQGSSTRGPGRVFYKIQCIPLCLGGSPGEVREVPVTYVKQRKGCRMTCDIGEAAEGLENEL